MATLNDRVLDNGLTVLDSEANRVDICSIRANHICRCNKHTDVSGQ